MTMTGPRAGSIGLNGTRRTRGVRACRAGVSIAIVLALLGCAQPGDGQRGNEADEAARAALEVAVDEPALRTAPAVAPLPDAAGIAPPVREDAAPAGRWHVQDGPVAAWGAPNSETVLSLECDRARNEVIVQREASGVPADTGVITLDADGLRRGLPAAREVTALGPRLVARIPARDPLLDRLRTATRLRVQAGDDTLVTAAPGAALERVLDACRADRVASPAAAGPAAPRP